MPWHSGREWDSDSFTNTRSVKLPVKLSWSMAIVGVDKNTALKACTQRQKLSSKCQPPSMHRERNRGRGIKGGREGERWRKRTYKESTSTKTQHTCASNKDVSTLSMFNYQEKLLIIIFTSTSVYSYISWPGICHSTYPRVQNAFKRLQKIHKMNREVSLSFTSTWSIGQIMHEQNHNTSSSTVTMLLYQES